MTDQDQNRTLLGLTVQIVAAHVQNNSVPADELPVLIQQVYGALAGAGTKRAEPVAEKPAPVVPARKSIFPDYIICLEDGRKLKTLKRHLRSTYNMTPEQYREKWGLPPDYPMVAPNYAEHRSALAKQLGLGRKTAEIEVEGGEVPETEPARVAYPKPELRDAEPRRPEPTAQSVFSKFPAQQDDLLGEDEAGAADATTSTRRRQRKPFSKQLARSMRS